MKKTYLRWSLFIGLALVLAAGLSYLMLNPVSQVEDAPEGQVMSIALVNEDAGATFNNNELAFGDAFVSSVENNNEHEWYVVSRGVAENGLENNTYDMMIVIPNDFSEKALSINSDAPEHVVLNYKVNASDNDNVRTEAEKTASDVLNNFNQQIIDVYFASIIGNLQDAQDSVAEIVNEDAQHTYMYNNSIYNPIANYTTQFETVKNSTEVSRESFSGLEDVLASFEESLTNETETAQNYQSSIQDTAELQDNNRVSAIDFHENLLGLHDGMTGGDVQEQLRQLEAMNELLQSQFELADENNANILTGTARLNVHFNDMLDVINETEARVNERLNPDALENEARETVSSVMQNVFPEDESLQISTLLEQPEKNLRTNINNLIAQLPSMEPSDFDGIGLPEETVQEIKNVIAVTNKYNNNFEYVASSGDEETISDKLNSLEHHLATEGVTVTDTVKIPENEKSGQVFTLTNIPENYEVTNLSIKLPNQQAVNPSNKQIELPANEAGEFTVKATFKLDGNIDSLDVYDPIKWGWKIVQEDTTDAESEIEQIEKENEKDNKEDKEKSEEIASIQVSYIPEIATMSMPGTGIPSGGEQGETPDESGEQADESVDEEQQQDSTEDNQESGNNGDQDESDNGQETEQSGEDSNSSDQPGEPDSSDKQDDDQSNGQDTENDDQTTPDDSGNDNESDQSENENNNSEEEESQEDENQEDKEEDKEIEIETVEVVNNTIQHQVMSEVTDMDNVTQDLIETTSKTISPYQQLASLYESYFGLNMNGDIASVLNQGSLLEISDENSLYTVFNKKDISTLMEDYVVGRAMDTVTSEVRQPLENLQGEIAAYRELVETADSNAQQLAESVVNTREQAAGINENLAELITNVSQWREQSLNVVEQQSEVQANNEKEQTAVMSLAEGFQPLLTASESLRDQADSNLYSAETVYETFETIDEQATTIQESGVELVQTSEDLSSNMTDKLLNDQEFVNNFTEVLANSRVGDRPNEDLYEFLSNPVQTESQGVITSGNSFTPYFVVLITFIVVLFTAYVISAIKQKRLAGDQFDPEQSLMGQNALITAITGGIGIAEGLLIGLLSGYFLQITGGSLLVWTGFLVLITVAMLFVSTYLLRQLNMFGMFILLAVLSMYLLLTRALGNGPASLDGLHMYSPLQYVENFIASMLEGTANYGVAVVVLAGISVIGVLANLLVKKPAERNEAEDDEAVQKAN